jgi:hypothetical protein
VPQAVLFAVGYAETHLDSHDGEPSFADAGAHSSAHVADLLRWSRTRLDTILLDVPCRWRRAVLESLLPSVDVLVVAA